jgi:hypothetical protein
MLAPPSTQHDRGVDDVGRSSRAAELAGFSRAPIVQGLDVDIAGAELFPRLTDELAMLSSGPP